MHQATKDPKVPTTLKKKLSLLSLTSCTAPFMIGISAICVVFTSLQPFKACVVCVHQATEDPENAVANERETEPAEAQEL